jgi:hypothetical protein
MSAQGIEHSVNAGIVQDERGYFFRMLQCVSNSDVAEMVRSVQRRLPRTDSLDNRLEVPLIRLHRMVVAQAAL